MFRKILIATDGSELATRALEHGLSLAAAIRAEVAVITVIPPYQPLVSHPDAIAGRRAEFEREVRAQAEEILAAARVAAEAAGVACTTHTEVNDKAYRGIIDMALAGGFDLIVMASHGRRGFQALVLGSEAVGVLTHSTVPVLVYR